MKKLSRVVGWVLAVGMVLAVFGAGAGYVWLRTLLPLTDGTANVPGLETRTTITRDGDGLVYIRAANDSDAYFALGYAHAQDRMWQMEATRRLAAGRLAEIGGSRFLQYDRSMRLLGVYRLAEGSLKHLSPEARAALDAYVRGVNAWIDARRDNAGAEFFMFGVTVEPWRAADSLVWARLMALRLSGRWQRILNRAELAARLGPDAMARLNPPDPEGAPVTVPYPKQSAGLQPRAPSLSRDDGAILRDVVTRLMPERPASDTASNTWAVSGARTGSGKPVMANDPHLGLRLPNIWHLVRIDTPDMTLAGATAPGVPFHILGHNGHIAWGMTTTGADTQDLVRETKVGSGYQSPDGPQPFMMREEVIRVRAGDDVRMTVRETRNGPVVHETGDHVFTLRAAWLRGDDATAEALYRINRARDWAAFTAALSHFHSPVQNLTYADTAGHIGFSLAGRIPIGGAGADGGILDGARRDHDWQGFIDAPALPRLFDPARGVIVNANNRVVGDGYPYRIADRFDAPYRAMRVEELLAATAPHDMAASRRMQMDNVSLVARELAPLFLSMTPPAPGHEAARRLLASWDGSATRDLAQPLIFNAWYAYLANALFDDETEGAFSGANPVLITRVLKDDPAWCDDVRTPDTVEACPQILARALEDALADLRGRFGDDMAAWRWGNAHVAPLQNQALDWLPLIGALSRGTIATDGDNYTLNRGTTALRRGGPGGRAPFRHVHGPVLRAIYDLADLDASLFAMPGGQSGHLVSAHYTDLSERWRDGDYLRLPAVPKGPLRVLTLTPAPAAHP